MKGLWHLLGNMAFWAAWPLIWLGLQFTRRTRVLVIAEGKVLVLKGWLGSGQWGLPGGGLHWHEDSLQGAIRELAEETGLRCTPDQLQPLGEVIYTTRGLRTRSVCFAVELPTTPSVKKRPLEIIGTDWLSPQEATQPSVEPIVQQLLQAWSKL